MTAITCQPKREVKFYGPLAKKLKRRSFKAIGLNSASEVMRCLLSNFPELESYMRGRYYRVVMNGRAISKDELDHQVKSLNEIHIIPAICGAGGGPLTSILTGVALIGAGILFPFAAPFLTPLGIGLVLQGVAELISPTPRDRPESTDPSARSYNFSGLQQTTREGVPVPLVYGEIMTGSIVISSKVEEDDDGGGGGGGLFDSGTGNPNPDQNPVPDPVVESPFLNDPPLTLYRFVFAWEVTGCVYVNPNGDIVVCDTCNSLGVNYGSSPCFYEAYLEAPNFAGGACSCGFNGNSGASIFYNITSWASSSNLLPYRNASSNGLNTSGGCVTSGLTVYKVRCGEINEDGSPSGDSEVVLTYDPGYPDVYVP